MGGTGSADADARPARRRRGLAAAGAPIARDLVWVEEDACDAFVRAGTRALDDRGAVINIASGTRTTLEALVGIARRVLLVQAEPVWGSMPARSSGYVNRVGDPRLAEQALGWRANTTLGAGLERMAAWFDGHPELAARYESSAT